jgi:hypothetical protein
MADEETSNPTNTTPADEASPSGDVGASDARPASDVGSNDEASGAPDEAPSAPSHAKPAATGAKPHGTRPVAPPVGPAGPIKSFGTFLVVFAALSAGFWVLSTFDSPFGGGGPKWREGQKVTVDVTLDPKDDQKLACASSVEVKGRACEFESKTKRRDGKREDAQLLRPYTTTDGTQFLAAGLWSQPDLKTDKRPDARFTVKCTMLIEGKVKSPAVRWDPTSAWIDKPGDFFTANVESCSLVK